MSVARTARMLAAVEAQTIPNAIGAALDRMVAIQVQAYPQHWTEEERREMAERHLFGGIS